MSPLRLIVRSLLHYRRSHAAVLLGVLVSAAVLVGAWMVGDSVRHTLRRIVTERLGRTEYALQSGERFFRAAWAEELSGRLAADVVPDIRLRGLVLLQGGERRAGGVEILGVDHRFWGLGGVEDVELAVGEAAVGGRLAERLELREGDEIMVRTRAPGGMPAEAPLAAGGADDVSFRVRVARILADDELGRFDLRANHVAPLNLLVRLDELAGEIERPGAANGMLAASREGSLDGERLVEAMRSWRPADAGLELRPVPGSEGFELVSGRIFLEDPVVEAARDAWPDARGIFTYFVNSLTLMPEGGEGVGPSIGPPSTPYSFVSAIQGAEFTADLGPDEMVINSWLAEDLGAGPADAVEMRYFVLRDDGSLAEESAVFRIHSVVPVDVVGPSVTPPFPGLSGVENCTDWDTSAPIDLERIRPKDEDYWDACRATPKAFISLETARRLWSNAYGSLTALRTDDLPEGGGGRGLAEAERRLMERLDPARLGLVFRPVREEGLRAGAGGVDFSGLFFGFSFFLLAASLLLTALLFLLGVESRTSETGLLLAVGFTPGGIRSFRLAEALIVAVAGGVLGSACAVAYNAAVLRGLGTVWRGAVGIEVFQLRVRAGTLIGGALAAAAVAAAVVSVVIWRQSGRPVVRLQQTAGAEPGPAVQVRGARRPAGDGGFVWILGPLCLVAAVGLSVYAGLQGERRGAALFFVSGALLLCFGVLAFRLMLLRWSRLRGRRSRFGFARLASAARLGMRGAGRNRRRSLVITALLASGIFIVAAVGANRRTAGTDHGDRDSGTGGFLYYAETDLPVLEDIETAEGRESMGLGGFQSLDFVGFRVREGDDASCLNLNRTQMPRLLGVDPRELAERGAFRFLELEGGAAAADPWSALEMNLGEDTIPAVADRTVIIWGLGKSVGDTLDYVDEAGRPFRVRLVAGIDNSIFQGSVLISETNFRGKFPSIPGRRVFLVEARTEAERGPAPGASAPGVSVSGSRTSEPTAADSPAAGAVKEAVGRSLRNQGVEVVSTLERLAEFNRVENTYLSIFLSLGGLGLILGSLGLGIVVLRSVQERRGELALMRAVGFSRGYLVGMLAWENGILLAAGAVVGCLSGLLAALPALLAPGAEVPVGFLAAVLGILLANGLLWIAAAAFGSTRGDLLAALRSE